jgi:hypothetical protein
MHCLKHRHPSDHACSSPPAKKSALLSSPGTTLSKESFLSKLKEWSSNRKSANTNQKGSLLKGLLKPKNKENSTVLQRGMEIGQLRREAKGDVKITQDKRIYVHGEGPPNLTTPLTSATQVLRKPVYYSKVCILKTRADVRNGVMARS